MKKRKFKKLLSKVDLGKRLTHRELKFYTKWKNKPWKLVQGKTIVYIPPRIDQLSSRLHHRKINPLDIFIECDFSEVELKVLSTCITQKDEGLEKSIKDIQDYLDSKTEIELERLPKIVIDSI